MSTCELVPSVSIANLVSQRAAVIERITQAAGLLRDAAAIAQAGHLGMPRVMITADCGGRSGREKNLADARLGARRDGSTWERTADERADVDKIIRLGVDAAAWQYLMHESGLRSLMDAAARKTWDEAIARGDIPDLTDANIRSTFKMLHDSRGEMFERGVIACFKNLAWCYKTNLPQKFGKRIVMTYLTGSGAYARHDQLDDLVRVFHVLEGKPEPDHRNGIRAKLDEAGFTSWTRRCIGVLDTEYLSIRVFKNMNGHITFRRPDLVDRMNLIIAKHYPGALPAPK